MPDISAEELARVNNLPKLVKLLRDHLDWPLEEDDFDEITYAYEPHELGLKGDEAAKVREVFQLRPLVTNQPWGVFFVSFDEKQLSVTVLRRILRALVVTKRGESKGAERAAWDKSDLIFAANFGKSGERELAFVQFSEGADNGDLPVMKVLGWNANDTKLHNDYAARMLTSRLAWPDDESDEAAWRKQWSGAFEIAHHQVIKTSRDLALHLAGLATQIRARANELLEAEADDGPMRTMLEAFRKNLIHDLDEDGFADMFAQTICYGMLAAAISRPSGALMADNMADMVPRTNPFLKELFANFLKLGGRDKRSNLDFDELGVREVVDMLQRADMPAVLRDFGDRNPKEDPVIHFYELFLKEYDPAKRMQRGVFYTPRPVVNFIVRGVDEILCTEFDLRLGLADTTTWGELAARNEKVTVPDHIDPDQPFVQILDPATGTGTFLVEVIELIHKRMVEHWQGEGMPKAEIAEAWNEYVPARLLPRLTAFELMMAPYSIAHMKVGLKLAETGYKFASDERARIFLTNALEPAHDLDLQFDFISQALAHEAKAASYAKEQVPYTVVIGNPPYGPSNEKINPTKLANGKPNWIGALLEDYLVFDGARINERNPKPVKADEIKFLRLASWVLERSGYGINGFINPHGYLDAVITRGMRQSLRKLFDRISILNLHGNANRGLVEGDENVFEIRQGVSINIFRRTGRNLGTISIADMIGSRDDGINSKYKQLLEAGINDLDATKIEVMEFDRGLISGAKIEQVYEQFPSLCEAFLFADNGFKSHRDHFAISIDAKEIQSRIADLRNQELSLDSLASRYELSDNRDWSLADARASASKLKECFTVDRVIMFPFDVRYSLLSTILMDFPRSEVLQAARLGPSLVTSRQTKDVWDVKVADAPINHKALAKYDTNYLFPLWLAPERSEDRLRTNINRKFGSNFGRGVCLTYNDGIPRGEQQSMGADYRHRKTEQIGLLDQPWDGRGDLEKDFGPRDLFDWIYAILHAPSYRSRYAEFLKSDFPRIPIPKDRATFVALIPLGRRLVALHLLKAEEEPVLKNPDIRFAGTGEARVEKGYPRYTNGKVEISASRWFEDVPKETWKSHVGGYQVCDKWLKDRAGKGGQNPRPGRILTEEDILHYRRVVTALTETRKIMAEIDEAIEWHGSWAGAFAIAGDAGQGA